MWGIPLILLFLREIDTRSQHLSSLIGVYKFRYAFVIRNFTNFETEFQQRVKHQSQTFYSTFACLFKLYKFRQLGRFRKLEILGKLGQLRILTKLRKLGKLKILGKLWKLGIHTKFLICHCISEFKIYTYLHHSYPIKNYRCCTGGPTLDYGGKLYLYVSHMLRVNMTRDLAHLQSSDLQREIRPIWHMPNVWITGRNYHYTSNIKGIIPIEIISRK